MKSFLKLILIILLLGFISISPKSRNLIGTSFDYLSKFILSTVNSKNKDKWLMDKPKWLNNKDFELLELDEQAEINEIITNEKVNVEVELVDF
tara:strand:- start:633 stop:911 length:279 start_codon:yes stop_codon:yes gene_type:complete